MNTPRCDRGDRDMTRPNKPVGVDYCIILRKLRFDLDTV